MPGERAINSATADGALTQPVRTLFVVLRRTPRLLCRQRSSWTIDLSVGVLASHYEQITGDSGSCATLGSFKGRNTPIGGTIGYNFQVGTTPMLTRAKVSQEVETKNRSVSLPEVSFPTLGCSVVSDRGEGAGAGQYRLGTVR